MWTNRSSCPLAALLFSSLALFGCSSDGGGEASAAAPVYAGNMLPAAVTAASAEDIGRAVTEGLNEAVDLMSTGDAIPVVPIGVKTTNTSSNALPQRINEVATKVLASLHAETLPMAAVISSDQLNAESGTTQFCGGSVAVPDNINPNEALNFTMTFFSLCYDDGITPMILNGVLTFNQTDTAFTIGFTNFSVTIDGKVESFTGTFTCDAAMSNCAIATDFAGSEGEVFRLENVDIDGDEFSGYTISADFYHDEHGMVQITTDMAVTYGNCDANPDGGAISLSGSGGSSMSISFNPDCSFTIEGFDGSTTFGPETLSWSAI